jgi:hypothetical protein
VEFVRKECVDRGLQVEITFVLSSQKCRFGTGAVQGMRRLDEVSELRL